MKVNPKSIEFNSIEDVLAFVRDYNAGNMLRFLNPIEDNSGNILVKEEVQVKESALARLKEIKGQYTPEFKIKLTKELTGQIQDKLTEKIVYQLKQTDKKFLKYMYEENAFNFKGIIRNSLSNRKHLLSLFKVYETNPNFFKHICELGLLALGIVMIPDALKYKMLRRYSFLGGIFMDIARVTGDHWNRPFPDDTEKTRIAKQCANFMQKLDLPEFVCSAASNHVPLGLQDNAEVTAGGGKKGEGEILDESFFADLMVDDGESDAGNQEDEDDAGLPDKSEDILRELLTDSLKIARYIHTVSSFAHDKEYVMEELVYFLAYNTTRGYFNEVLANPLVNLFKQFEENVKRMRKLAEVEMQCLHPPAAWAYPKPKASQVLCKNKVWDCPNIVQGWDIHVISSQDAFGWVGSSLNADHYPKCRLEEELDLLPEIEPKKVEKK
ncbi:hypothetical protein EHQ27_18010 [Leptospira wolffii]|uniref:hypothetical protein n=1 Tax=Leptospira wolffii TaxID=409998 RepID=UPI000349952C|nr:hypothetical protein [Leptospira wolffii]TGK61821.1 hypothetical protein EHQ32_02925 [Leptospira wolffii]TGK65908.1 hypothetical protein EHQ27_18010 [Leptospira wolffii]TGK74795.1 hypothetical protein EHQ35_10855 [Leptospira wolffii]TGL30861.1 hypothetical protein EHQ57_05470 [Leptospira wolffii]